KIEAAAIEREKKRAELSAQNNETSLLKSVTNEAMENHNETLNQMPETIYPQGFANGKSTETKDKRERKKDHQKEEHPFANRKPISEVLQDIYDRNN
ncbi:MAG TPA: hypothetical protein PKY59_24615, partial [Pyrinomonadaceae bacterium]|nr:hypothetical protein [Pyrinomonadaceae bacterium]